MRTQVMSRGTVGLRITNRRYWVSIFCEKTQVSIAYVLFILTPFSGYIPEEKELTVVRILESLLCEITEYVACSPVGMNFLTY